VLLLHGTARFALTSHPALRVTARSIAAQRRKRNFSKCHGLQCHSR